MKHDYSQYNFDTPENAFATSIMVTGVVLFKEGYKSEQVQEILQKIADVSMAVFEKKATVTDHGILFNENNNVVTFNGT
jgi:hypothetical protein